MKNKQVEMYLIRTLYLITNLCKHGYVIGKQIRNICQYADFYFLFFIWEEYFHCFWDIDKYKCHTINKFDQFESWSVWQCTLVRVALMTLTTHIKTVKYFGIVDIDAFIISISEY